MFNANLANDWIQTGVLWSRKQQLYQLTHNHLQNWKHFVLMNYLELQFFLKIAFLVFLCKFKTVY